MNKNIFEFREMDYKDPNKKKIKPLFKHQTLITCIAVIAVVVASLGTTLAVFTKTDNGTEYNVVQAGELSVSYVDLNDEGNVLQLNNEFPVSDEVGSSGSAYRFSVENTGTIVANYTVKIINDEDTIEADGCSNNLLDDDFIRYQFDNGEIGTLKDLLDADGSYVISSGTLQPFESNIHEIKLWLSDTSPNSVLGTHYHGKVVIDVEQGEGTNPNERPVDTTTVAYKTFASDNLGSNCATYNDGTDTFLVGQCSQNYVWYSGKLWRVVLKNNATGAVKMVTDNAITVIDYGEDSTFENSYVDQWLNQEFLPTLHDYEDYLVVDSIWDSTAVSMDTPSRPQATTTTTRAVGLLNAYEYYTTYNKSDGLATSETGYLYEKNAAWYLITKYDDNENLLIDNGTLTNILPLGGWLVDSVGIGIKPCINMQSTNQIVSGTGSKSDPYILDGDLKEIENGATLLSTRYSGEYVTFNNSLYRIMDTETLNGKVLTKIIAVDIVNEEFSWNWDDEGLDGGLTDFNQSTLKTDLENYYQKMASTDSKSYSMIQPNTIWYIGSFEEGLSLAYNYKSLICITPNDNTSIKNCAKTTTTSTTSIGLPRAGEMFASQITRNNRENFLTLTTIMSLGRTGIYITPNNTIDGMDGTYSIVSDARPSMYLKSDVIIASDNTGNGTYEYPYSLEYSPALITFDIMFWTGSTYSFTVPSGYTWEQFVGSEYDDSKEKLSSENYFKNEGGYIYSGPYYASYSDGSGLVAPADEILDGYTYRASSGGND